MDNSDAAHPRTSQEVQLPGNWPPRDWGLSCPPGLEPQKRLQRQGERATWGALPSEGCQMGRGLWKACGAEERTGGDGRRGHSW